MNARACALCISLCCVFAIFVASICFAFMCLLFALRFRFHFHFIVIFFVALCVRALLYGSSHSRLIVDVIVVCAAVFCCVHTRTHTTLCK